jgi:FkbM family methyltransferase
MELIMSDIDLDLQLLQKMSVEHASKFIQYLSKSNSQLRQDLFVLSQLNFKTNGYFVEFGATDGVGISNTYLLEKEFGWKGILAEPAKYWHNNLKSNRNAHIETNCVWSESNSILSFNEVNDVEFSTIDVYSDTGGDYHKQTRKFGKTYNVKTISLNDLLLKYNAPKNIDYLSIDTEGSEFEILNTFDFAAHRFNVITCEHNFTPMREQILDLLTKNGYNRVYQEISQFDDWYINEEML